MKRLIPVLLLAFFFLSSARPASALDTNLFEVRNRFLNESKEIKLLLPQSKDSILISSMWHSCLVTITQLDAYFSMLGLFNSIKQSELSRDAVNYLVDWLREIKRTTALNINNLNSMPQPAESQTRAQADRLKARFGELSNRIDAELRKISLLEKALKLKAPK